VSHASSKLQLKGLTMNFSISPNAQLVFTILAAAVGAIATGVIGAPPGVAAASWATVHDWCAYIVGWAAIFSPILPALSSAKAGLLVKKDAP
jgi:hypothetical protein